jgi:hypothetical protein
MVPVDTRMRIGCTRSMATLHFTATTSATPEQFVAALTDFGPGRSTIFEKHHR